MQTEISILVIVLALAAFGLIWMGHYQHDLDLKAQYQNISIQYEDTQLPKKVIDGKLYVELPSASDNTTIQLEVTY